MSDVSVKIEIVGKVLRLINLLKTTRTLCFSHFPIIRIFKTYIYLCKNLNTWTWKRHSQWSVTSFPDFVSLDPPLPFNLVLKNRYRLERIEPPSVNRNSVYTLIIFL